MPVFAFSVPSENVSLILTLAAFVVLFAVWRASPSGSEAMIVGALALSTVPTLAFLALRPRLFDASSLRLASIAGAVASLAMVAVAIRAIREGAGHVQSLAVGLMWASLALAWQTVLGAICNFARCEPSFIGGRWFFVVEFSLLAAATVATLKAGLEALAASEKSAAAFSLALFFGYLASALVSLTPVIRRTIFNRGGGARLITALVAAELVLCTLAGRTRRKPWGSAALGVGLLAFLALWYSAATLEITS